jgi:predicted exporter
MRRMRAFFLLLVWAGLTAFGLSRLSFNVDVLDLLPAGRPEFVGIRDLYRHFGRESELIITLSADDAETARSAAKNLADRLSQRPDLAKTAVWHLPFEEEPGLAGELLAWLWFNGSPEELGTLEKGLSPEQAGPRVADAVDLLASGFLDASTFLLGYDPLGFTELPGGLRESAGADAGLFASEDGTYRAVYVEAPGEFANYRETAAWIDAIRAEIAAVGFSGEVGITGEPAFVAEISLAMEGDMQGSVISALLLIAAMFWLWHRRLVPLVWLMLMLGLIFSATFAIGGLWFGQLTAMSVGFAAILLGLAVDYGVILYRETAKTGGDTGKLRQEAGPGIFWAAMTTAVVFAALNLSSLPGIAELGTLVAVGIVVGASVMLGIFAPLAAGRPMAPTPAEPAPGREGSARFAFVITGFAIAAGVVTWLVAGPPAWNREARPFQIKDSSATAAMDEMTRQLGGEKRSVPVVVTAPDPQSLAEKLHVAEARVAEAKAAGLVSEYKMPLALAPDPAQQAANREAIRRLSESQDRLVRTILDGGFTEEATALTRRVLEVWQTYAEGPATDAPRLPDSPVARWLLGRAVSLPAEGGCAAVGILVPAAWEPNEHGAFAWAEKIDAPGIQTTGWEALNPVLQTLVAGDFRRVFLPMGLILVVVLFAVFRNVRDATLALGGLIFSGAALFTLTTWLSIEWNAFNVSSVPILFGTGIDYGIHMIFALRRSGGDLAAVRSGIAKALWFCGLSTVVGFGSLAFASSEGLSSLGLVCGLGILLNMLTAICLLPWWWKAWHQHLTPRLRAVVE